MQSFFDVVFNRTSIRLFIPGPVSDDEVSLLLKSAMAAPSASNKQPSEFVVIHDRETLNILASALPYAKMADGASLGIVVCAVPGRAHESSKEYAVIDASIACENLLLAVEAMGLGAVWTALYPQSDRQETARRLLGIPQDIIPLALIPIGRPRIKLKAKDKYRAEYIHREHW